MAAPIRLVVVDDHPLILEGLDRLFRLEEDLEIVAKCVNAKEALEAVRAHRPDLLILDLRLPGRRGLEVLEEVQREGLPTRTVLLTGAITEEELVEALRLGVRGVVLKEMAPELLVRCVRKVWAGELWLESGLLGRAVTGMLHRDGVAGGGRRTLTAREIRIVRMAASGLHNREIAEELSITEGTVKVHLHNIYEKLAVTGRVELTIYARDQGWV
ncbi:MAG TPA: response regulator transcription factor [Thermoanaerobaculia bacterium]|nr:response regulator transcription factor [Thermoanaerobaculia bacterium]